MPSSSIFPCHVLVSRALLYYCPLAKPPLPPILEFHRAWIIWSSRSGGLPQWRTMAGFRGSVGAWWATELASKPGPGKFAHNAAHSHRPTLCKARPSWKRRTYFASRCQPAQNGQSFPGSEETGATRCVGDSEPRPKQQTMNFPETETWRGKIFRFFICRSHSAWP